MGSRSGPHDIQLQRVRQRCCAFPAVTERISHGSPSFFVRDKKTFVSFVDDHHGDGILGIWVAAPPGEQEALIAADGEVFFRPAYVGHRGWVGVRLDHGVTDDLLDELIEAAYRVVAPKALIAELDRRSP